MVTRMVYVADVRSKTTTPGHDTLAAHVGCGVRTITSDIKLLHKAGLLSTVAKGRSAECVPKASITAEGVKGTKWKDSQNPNAVTNERAVYAFIEPLTGMTLEVMGSEPVDKVCHPATPTECSYPPHTRETERNQKGHGYAATEKPSEAPSGCAPLPLWQDRSVPSWPRHETTNAGTKRATRENELRAAVTLQRRAFPLRRISAKHLAFVLRVFFVAGWTVADLQMAMENRPDGGRITHDFADGVRFIAPWLKHRMSPWMPGGKPMYSPRQLREKGRAPLFVGGVS